MRWASRNEEGERRWMSVTGQERAAGCRASCINSNNRGGEETGGDGDNGGSSDSQGYKRRIICTVVWNGL
jgi:hypothetical protein